MTTMDELTDLQLARIAVGRMLTFRPKNAGEQDDLDYLKEQGELVIYRRLVELI
jgi:hypothetical protein